jgi:DNA replication protein DnaC
VAAELLRRFDPRSLGRDIVILVGAGGEGKSQMLCAVVRRCILAGVAARWVKAERFSDEIACAEKGGYGRASVIEVHDRYARCKVLAIDEICKPGKWPSDRERLRQLIQDRYDRMLPTLIAGNMSEQALAEGNVIPPVVLSRLSEAGKIRRCGWGDIRPRLLPRPSTT